VMIKVAVVLPLSLDAVTV
jgi:hypothetical protein